MGKSSQGIFHGIHMLTKRKQGERREIDRERDRGEREGEREGGEKRRKEKREARGKERKERREREREREERENLKTLPDTPVHSAVVTWPASSSSSSFDECTSQRHPAKKNDWMDSCADLKKFAEGQFSPLTPVSYRLREKSPGFSPQGRRVRFSPKIYILQPLYDEM